jgi:uncharacterized damage-inducible protein DinB
MAHESAVTELKSTKEFFDRSTRCLTEEDSSFAPAEGTWTVAQQVAHVAQTVDWFTEGAFRPEGFDMDFEKLTAETGKVTSLQAAREYLDAAFARALQAFGPLSDEELGTRKLPPNPIMGEVPLTAVISAVVDHTAHHRGALTVYARLRGKVPAMPYMEMEEPASVTA